MRSYFRQPGGRPAFDTNGSGSIVRTDPRHLLEAAGPGRHHDRHREHREEYRKNSGKAGDKEWYRLPAGTLQRLSDHQPAQHKENINRRATMRDGILCPIRQHRERRHVAQQHVKRQQTAEAIQRVRGASWRPACERKVNKVRSLAFACTSRYLLIKSFSAVNTEVAFAGRLFLFLDAPVWTETKEHQRLWPALAWPAPAWRTSWPQSLRRASS